MNHNLAAAYAPTPSKPRSMAMTFSAPDAPDFLFDGTLPVRIVCTSLMRTVSVSWRLCRNRVEAPILSGVAESNLEGTFTIAPDAARLEPGFYDIQVIAHYTDTQQAEGATTFGWRCDEEPIVQVVPDDFDAYWLRAMDRAASTPLAMNRSLCLTLAGDEIGRYNVECAMLPEHYDPEGEIHNRVEVFQVDFASPIAGRVHAWFAKPVGEGPFPAMLVMPGAGNGARPAPVEHARHGYAAMDLQVHGNPVDLAIYDRVPSPDYSSPDAYVHYEVYHHALQAVNAIAALPSVDLSRLAVVGGSQGGRLSYVMASLDSRIKAAIPAIPHYCYRPWLRWTETMNASGKTGAEAFGLSDIVDDDRTRVESYYDVINFVPKMKARLLTNGGLIDPVSPATGARAAFRLASTEKQFVSVPNFGHDWFPAFDRYAWRWLNR